MKYINIIFILFGNLLSLSYGNDLSKNAVHMGLYEGQTKRYEVDKDEFLLWKDFCDANFDKEETFLRFSELIKVGKKPSGVNTEGGVYQDQDGVIWFVKKTQSMVNDEYLGAKLMNLLIGPWTPEVKLIEDADGYTASKKILKFVQQAEVSSLDQKPIVGQIKLNLAMDLIRLGDQSEQNMGYINEDNRLEAARVDFNPCFDFEGQDIEKIYDGALCVIYWKQTKESNPKTLEIAMEELLAIPDWTILKTLSEGIADLIARGVELDTKKYQELGLRLIERKQALGLIYKKLKDIDAFMENIKQQPELFINGLYDKLLLSSSYGVLIALMSHPELLIHEEISMELWDKILESKKPAGVLRTLSRYPRLISFNKLIHKILSKSFPDEILEYLGKNPQLLDDETNIML